MPDISDRYNGRIEASLAEQRLRRFGKDRGKPCQSEQHPAGFLYRISICERRGNPPSLLFIVTKDPSRDIQMWLVF